ncbi:MAG: PqqD family protein [Candidatus Omnitrophica bacterium]|nr:PqqD family protein [Candidatus Omnitrophota bacterium]
MTGVYSKNPDVVFRKIADEFLLIPVRQKAIDLKSIYTLNEAAAFIWDLIDGNTDILRMGERFTEEFEVEAPQAASDITSLLSQFEALSFIRKT